MQSMILFKIPLNTLKFCFCVSYSIEFGAQYLYFMYKLSLNLIERNIPYDAQLVFYDDVYEILRFFWHMFMF